MATTYSLLGTSGQFGNLNPTIVDSTVRLVAFTMTPWPQLINWKTRSGPGSAMNIIQSTYTTAMTVASEGASTGMGDLSPAGGYTTAALTVTQTLKGLDFPITLMAERFQAANDFGHITDTIAKSYFKRVDTDCMSAINTAAGSGANRIGTSGTPITYANSFLPAFTLLAQGSAEPPIYWVLASPQIAEAGGEQQFSQWRQLGQAWLDQNINLPSGYLGISPWGVQTYYSNNYASNSPGNAGVMFAKNAIELHEDMPYTSDINTIQRLNTTRSTVVAGTTIYGVGSARDSATANTWCVTTQS